MSGAGLIVQESDVRPRDTPRSQGGTCPRCGRPRTNDGFCSACYLGGLPR